MKIAEIVHNLSLGVGGLGVLFFFGVGYLRITGDPELFGMNEEHLFFDAAVLLLVAIWLNLSALYHKK